MTDSSRLAAGPIEFELELEPELDESELESLDTAGIPTSVEIELLVAERTSIDGPSH